MATSLSDTVVHWRKKLEKNTNDEDTVLNVIRKLSKIPITIDILQETHIGKCIRKLSKRTDTAGVKAHHLLMKWRDIFSKEKETVENCSKSVKNSSSKKENVNKETVTKHFKETVPSKSSKHDISHSHDKLHQKTETHDKHKYENNSSNKSSFKSSKYINGDCEENLSETSSPSLYTYEKKEFYSKNMDYDPNLDSSEPYNPACPELYPGSGKSHKLKKFDLNVSTYEPTSLKRKLNEDDDDDSPVSSKKLKTSSHLNGNSPNSSYKHSQVKEKHNFHKDKSKDHKSNSLEAKMKSCEKLKSSELKQKSSESKKSKHKECNEKKNSTPSKPKAKVKINSREEFTSSEVRFEDCLGFNDIVVVKKKKSTKTAVSNSKKPQSRNQKTSDMSVQHGKVPKEIQKEKHKVSKPSVKSEVDILSTLPEIQPFYKPLPQRNFESFSSPKKKAMTNEEAIKFTSSRREKTAVYSGRKNLYFTEVPSLADCCTRILIENIDAIEYLGGVPYYIMKPVLERCSAAQLHMIEDYNPYLLEETHELWEVHCKRDFKRLQPEEHETWRDLYERAHDERERRLKSITANISASMSKSNPVRQVKLAYINSVVKPPRDVARRQAKHGTALPVNQPMKAAPPSKASPRPTAPAINSANSAASSAPPPVIIAPKKPKVAPLMAKTLKSMKQCFRR